MDSGSSGSIQSSSGGEEEYHSRAEGFSGFLNRQPGHVGPMAATKTNPSPPPTAATTATATNHPHSSSPSLFDPFSNFLDPLLPTRSHQNSISNLDFLWPRNPRSDHNPIQLPGSISMPPSSSHPQSYMAATNSQVPHQSTETNVHHTPRGLTLTTDRTDVVPNNTNNNTPTATAANNAASVRNPRKRTRASRRAPTTVLTTDTSNFRAMVQEFTGIPAPPFTPASSFPRARLDLFGGTASTSSPPYLLRPFPQKLSTTNSLLSPSSDFLLPKQNHHLPPMSSIFNLQPPPLHQPNIINLLASDQPTTEPHRNHPLHQTPLPEELLSGSGNILPTTWGSGGNGGGGGGGGGASSDQALFRSMNSKYCTSTKLNNNYSASSSSLDFHGEKGSENVTTRSEGMIESWICSSD